MTVVVMMGIPGSGKSTYVREHYPSTLVICPDDIRERLTGDAGDQSRNKEVFEIAHALLAKAAEIDLDVVFDATNIKHHARKNILDICKRYYVNTHLIILNTSYEVALERNNQRDRCVPLHAMERMKREFDELMSNRSLGRWDKITYIS